MDREEMDKHLKFLNEYAIKHNIVFSVTRNGIKVEEL